MTKIFILNQEINNITNYQSFVINCESFQDYLDNIKQYLPKTIILYGKHINYKDQSVVLTFESKFENERYVEFMHFAKVIN